VSEKLKRKDFIKRLQKHLQTQNIILRRDKRNKYTYGNARRTNESGTGE
jgi:hypothetical protein